MPLLAWESEVDEESESLTVHESCTSSSDDDVRGSFLPRDIACLVSGVFSAISFKRVESVFV
jgi:hypothetical protein